jgi:predicted nucleic acid-binding Zn ribbon protein
MAFGKKPEPMGKLLKSFMKNIPQKTELQRGMVLHFWPEVVGDQIESVTQKLRFEGNTLMVHVNSDVWRHEIHANRFSIAKRLNEKVGSKVVKEIVVRV